MDNWEDRNSPLRAKVFKRKLKNVAYSYTIFEADS